MAAAAHGAALANYVEATRPTQDSARRLAGVNARDTLTGQTFDDSRADTGECRRDRGPRRCSIDTGVRTRWPLLEGDEPGDVASGAQGRAGRSHARRARARAAAVEGAARSSAPASHQTRGSRTIRSASRDEVTRFSPTSTRRFPPLGSKPDEVTLVHRGIVPAAAANGRMSLLGSLAHHRSRRRRRHTPELISIVGVKYTTARVVAERAVDLVLRKLGPEAGAMPDRRDGASGRRIGRSRS